MSPAAIVLAATLALVACSGAHRETGKSEDTTINMLIDSGQSNSQGQGDPTNVAPVEGYRVQGSTGPLVSPVIPDLLVGAEIQMYREMGKRLVVAKSAHNGASVAMFFRGQPFGTQLRDTRIHALDLIARAYPGQTISPRFLWIQGEAESANSGTATAYEGQLRQFLDELDTDWGHIETYIVLVNSGFSTLPFRSTVRAAQVTVAAEQSYRHTIDPDAITQHDGLHYNTAGYDALGSLVKSAIYP